jgi:hypothetical protein
VYRSLSHNRLAGGVHPIGEMFYLQFLYVVRHILACCCSRLQSVLTPVCRHRDLSHNNLTGTLPTSIGGLKHLSTIDLSNNQLQGDLSLVTGLQDLPIQNGSKLANNQFDCPLPTWALQATPCYRMWRTFGPCNNHESLTHFARLMFV